MNGIENITAKIRRDAQAYAERTLANAKERADEILDTYRRQAEAIYAEERAKGAREQAGVAERAVSSAEVLERNILLDARNALLQQAFTEAEAQLHALSAEEYTVFLKSCLGAAIDTLNAPEEDGFGYEPENPDLYRLSLNSRDSAQYGQALLSAVEKQVVARGCRITLTEEDDSIDGGFILKRGEAEVNCTLALLLKNARRDLEAEAYRVLFP